jgi:hypothetical protein
LINHQQKTAPSSLAKRMLLEKPTATKVERVFSQGSVADLPMKTPAIGVSDNRCACGCRFHGVLPSKNVSNPTCDIPRIFLIQSV